jgi:hypothetical protein
MVRTKLSLAVFVGLVLLQPAPAAVPDKLWNDLASADEATFARALLALGKTPQETLAFLKENLVPVKADLKRVAQLVADLDSNVYDTREKAAAELEYLGKYIKTDLEKALAGAQGAETKQKLQQLLDKMPQAVKEPMPMPPQNGKATSVAIVNGRVFINGVPADGPKPGPVTVGPPMTWVRAVRAIAILEFIGTPEAKQVLENLAGGEPDALPTQQAKAALERLSK